MRLFSSLLSIILLSSCAQLTRLDTARTIGEDNIELGAQLYAFGVNEEISTDLGPVTVPFLALELNYGMTEKVDLMTSANTAGNIFISPKFQVYGDRESQVAFALLPGADIQFGSFGGQNDPVIYFRPHFSTIVSFHQDNYALFLEPKYIYQYWTETHFAGSTIGMEFAKERISCALGVSYFPVLGPESPQGSSVFSVGLSARYLVKLNN